MNRWVAVPAAFQLRLLDDELPHMLVCSDGPNQNTKPEIKKGLNPHTPQPDSKSEHRERPILNPKP